MKENTEPSQDENDACEIKTPRDHKIMFRTLENSLRRKIVKSIGAFGKTKKEIICRLNAKGLDELLANVK